MSEKMKYTFWQLLNNYYISIPIIQRDYAQGRKIPQIDQIRNELLQQLHTSITKSTPINFDFIYGSIEGKSFIPLDGQQRLMTLFLLHWYVAVKDRQLDEGVKQVLRRFTYDTRASSSFFCSQLVEHGLPDSFFDNTLERTANTLSGLIKDAPWFFQSWEKDPTIQGMLVMMDAIDEQFNDCEHCFDQLISNEQPPITFQLLRLNDFGLSDSLYIKMNARGKPLTLFENFKAQLEGFLEEEAREGRAEFARKMDGDWTDLFWQYRDKNQLFDEAFMNFIRAVATNHFALNGNAEKKEKIISEELTDGNVEIYFPHYKILNCFDEAGISSLTDTADCLKNGHEEIRTYLPDTRLIDERRLFRELLANQQGFSYASRIQFYAITQFIIVNGSNCPDAFCDWMRVIRNLTKNYIYNGADEYIRDIRSVREMLSYSKDILRYLSNDLNEISGFSKVQKEEERIKAALILKDECWREKISTLENHGYFEGQIGFVLSFSGITRYFTLHRSVDWPMADNEMFMKSFQYYAERATAVFIDSGLRKFDNFVWERALFSRGNYMIYSGVKSSFLIDNDRDVSWKRLLRDDNERRQYVKDVFDNIPDVIEVEGHLHNIIQQALRDGRIANWQQHLIRHPEMLAMCHKRNILWEQEGKCILLLEKSQTNGWHREAYSFSLFLLLQQMGVTAEYVPQAARGDEKFISSINGQPVYISFTQVEDDWKYKAEVNGNNYFFSFEKEVLDFLVAQNYLAMVPELN